MRGTGPSYPNSMVAKGKIGQILNAGASKITPLMKAGSNMIKNVDTALTASMGKGKSKALAKACQ